MSLVHTLLFMFRHKYAMEDTQLASNCLKSLELSSYKTVVIYNQGEMSNEALKVFVAPFDLECHIIGDGINAGTVIGRQKCFEYIWENLPDTDYISELHMDMYFTSHWEDELVEYLENNDEPIVSCGIIDKDGQMPFLNKKAALPQNMAQFDEFLRELKSDDIVHGFTNPCVHVSKILRETGGYNAQFLKGRQCFEDDSMLLGYYYYYGTKRGWYPKINYNSVVYHAVAGQRLNVWDSIKVNFGGLVKQYGAMGLKALSSLHHSAWHKKYFTDRYFELVNGAAQQSRKPKVLLYGHKMFADDLAWGFGQAGCDTAVVHPENAAAAERLFGEANAELLITMGAPLELNREVMEYIGKNRPPRLKYIHWDTDGISSIHYRSKSGDGIEMDIIYLSKPDMVLTICPEMREFVSGKGFACELMHYAYSPVSHRPLPIAEAENDDIVLIGTSYISYYEFYPNHYRYSSVKNLVQPLLEHGHKIDFYGDTGYRPLLKHLTDTDVPEEYFHGYLPYEQTCAAYNASFINLVTQNHDKTLTKRTFEILGSGGFALSSDNAEIRRLFVPGRDLVVSSSPQQTLELVQYYRQHRDEWRKIRENAVLSVQSHTYKQRAEMILEKYRQL